MKQIIICLLLLTVFSIPAFSQKTKPVDYSQKIKEATPKPLPQTPVVKRQTTDAQEDNLKGKVKTVTSESEDLSGTWQTQGRKLSEITDFDENGNRIKQLLYDSNALPFEVSVYGYIDGKRVSDYEMIKLEERPIIMAITPNKNQERTKPDPRYKFSFEYKYTSGKLTEKKWIQSNGDLWIKYVYNHKGNQIEEIVYSQNGKLNQKYLSTLDNKGNEIESVEFDAFGNPSEIKSKYSVKYDSYDKKGNWTKKTTSKVIIENGKEVYKPMYINYQTITYYP